MLTDKGLYEEADDPIIDELLYNYSLIKRAKAGLKKDGLMINTVRDPKRDPYFQKNPLFSIYDTCLKNIQGLSVKLSITPQERAKLKIEAFEDNDGFDDDIK